MKSLLHLVSISSLLSIANPVAALQVPKNPGKFEINSLQSKDVHVKRGKRGHRGKRGYPGAMGPRGAEGPVGPQGPTGATGPAGFDSFMFADDSGTSVMSASVDMKSANHTEDGTVFTINKSGIYHVAVDIPSMNVETELNSMAGNIIIMLEIDGESDVSASSFIPAQTMMQIDRKTFISAPISMNLLKKFTEGQKVSVKISSDDNNKLTFVPNPMTGTAGKRMLISQIN